MQVTVPQPRADSPLDAVRGGEDVAVVDEHAAAVEAVEVRQPHYPRVLVGVSRHAPHNPAGIVLLSAHYQQQHTPTINTSQYQIVLSTNNSTFQQSKARFTNNSQQSIYSKVIQGHSLYISFSHNILHTDIVNEVSGMTFLSWSSTTC